jgi:RND family efflux transporter MFP subunit
MIARQVSYWAGIGVLGVALAGLAMAQASSSGTGLAESGVVLGMTMPSQGGRMGEQGQLHSLMPGRVRELLVKDGDTVKAGQVLIQLDDRLEKNALANAALQAKSRAALNAAEADLAQKRVELKRQHDLLAKGVVQQLELERAEVDVKVGEARVEVAKEEIEQKKLDAEKAAILLDYMQIKSPVDGVVKLEVGVGQRTEPERPVCTVRRSDPLWVRVNLKVKDALGLAVDDTVKVKYDGETEWTDAKVIYLNDIVDSASQKREIRLEMPNKAGKPPGLEVQVMLPAKTAAK